jgi:drug/metabolite transporter (DMT)-like permease
MAAKRFQLEKSKAVPVAALLFLCLLWSLASLRIDLLPALDNQALPTMEKQALPLGLLAITSSLIAISRRANRPQMRQIRSAILIGLGLFVAPAVLVSLSNQGISQLTRVALFSLVPVFTVVLEPHISEPHISEPHISGTTSQQPRGALIAALLAVGGTLCIFPADIPSSPAAAAAFGAVVLAAACIATASCLAVKAATESPITTTAAIAGTTALASFAVLGPLLERGRGPWTWNGIGPELAWSTAVDLPALLLLFWLMTRMSAVRIATRFVIAPLITALFGIALLRPQVSLRDVLGFLLLAAGAGWLLIAPDEEPDSGSLQLS